MSNAAGGTLLDFFTVGARAWADSNSGGASGVNNPVPNTQDGPAGQSQVTSYYEVLRNPLVIGAAVLAGVLIVALIVKR